MHSNLLEPTSLVFLVDPWEQSTWVTLICPQSIVTVRVPPVSHSQLYLVVLLISLPQWESQH